MSTGRPLPYTALVRIGKGTRVFTIRHRTDHTGVWTYLLDKGADHPDAGKRVPDVFRRYTADELTRVAS